MRVLKGRLAADELDFMECEVLQNALAFHVNDFTLVVHEVVDREILLEGIVDTVETALLEAGKVESGFAQGLAGNRWAAPFSPAGPQPTTMRSNVSLEVTNPSPELSSLQQLSASRRIVGEEEDRSRSFLSVGIC